MIRVCPDRDAICPHGMDCPFTTDRYRCDIEASRAQIREVASAAAQRNIVLAQALADLNRKPLNTNAQMGDRT